MAYNGRYSSRRKNRTVILRTVTLLAVVSITVVGGIFAFKGIFGKEGKENQDDTTIPAVKPNEPQIKGDGVTPPDVTVTPPSSTVTPPDNTTPPTDNATPPPDMIGPPVDETTSAKVYPHVPTEPYEKIGEGVDTAALTQEYQKKYPGLYAPKSDVAVGDPKEKVIYLTFDDGPTPVTDELLDTLDEHGIKATFFIVDGKKNADSVKERLNEIVKRGHTVGLHTHTHEYDTIYASVDAYLADLDAVNRTLYETTGVRATTFRFAGGSNNAWIKRKGILDDILVEMSRRGFRGYDWTASFEDATKTKYTAEQLADNAINTISVVGKTKPIVVLGHDAANKQTTAQSIPKLAAFAKENGYTFAAMDGSIGSYFFGGK